MCKRLEKRDFRPVASPGNPRFEGAVSDRLEHPPLFSHAHMGGGAWLTGGPSGWACVASASRSGGGLDDLILLFWSQRASRRQRRLPHRNLAQVHNEPYDKPDQAENHSDDSQNFRSFGLGSRSIIFATAWQSINLRIGGPDGKAPTQRAHDRRTRTHQGKNRQDQRCCGRRNCPSVVVGSTT